MRIQVKRTVRRWAIIVSHGAVLAIGPQDGRLLPGARRTNGALLWKTNLGGQTFAGPMTYQVGGKQLVGGKQYVATISGMNLVAFALR